MDFQIKLFSWEDKGNHLIIIGRGAMDFRAFKRLLQEIAAATRTLDECKVLVDLADGTLKLEDHEIDEWVGGLSADLWPAGNKVALVSRPAIDDYHRLYLLRAALVASGIRAGVFRDSKVAIDWLAGTI